MTITATVSKLHSCLLILLSLCIYSCGSLEQSSDDVDNAKQTKDAQGVLFKRSNLVVSDMDRSLTIYRDILGFTLNSAIETSDSDSYSYPVFKIPKSAKIRFVTMDTQAQERTLALTEVTGYELPKPSIPLMSALVIKVDDIIATIEKISALGLETTAIKLVPGESYNYKEQAFVDFDGHLIVLYELY